MFMVVKIEDTKAMVMRYHNLSFINGKGSTFTCRGRQRRGKQFLYDTSTGTKVPTHQMVDS